MLKGKTALITGTNRGIGKAFVEEFACSGADIIAHARRETPEFMQICEGIRAEYGVKVRRFFLTCLTVKP